MIFSSGILSQNIHREENFSYSNAVRPLLMMSLLCLFYGISAGINMHSFSLLLDGLDLSTSQTRNILSMDVLGSLGIACFVMILSYQFGLYKLIILSLTIRNLSLLIFLFAKNYNLLCFSQFCFGISGFVLYVCVFQWVNLIAVNRARATFIAIATTSFGLGISLGPIFLAITNFSLDTNIAISILISFLSFLPLIRIKNSEPILYRYGDTKLVYLFSVIRVPIMCAIATDYIFYAIEHFMPNFLMSYNYLQQNAYLLIGYFSLAGLIFSIPIGFILDKYNRIRILILFSLAIAVSVQIIPLVITNFVLILIVFFILSSSINGIIICMFAMIGDRFTGGNLILASSFVHAISVVGGYAGVYSTELVIDQIGTKGLIFSISSLFLVFLSLLLLEAYKHNKKHELQKAITY